MIKKAAYFFFLLLSTCLSIQSQDIDSPLSDARDTIIYETTSDTVLVFIYNSDENKTVTSGSLVASPPQDTSDFNFIWGKYDPETFSYVNFNNSTGRSATLFNLEEGGYRVIFEHLNGWADTVYAWLFINNFSVDIINETSEGKLTRISYTCDFFRMTGTAYTDTLVYYDPNDSSQHYLPSAVENIEWETETDDTDYAGLNYNKLTFFEYNKLAEDAVFRVTVTDKYGAQGRDTVSYEPIQVRAKMEKPVEHFLTDSLNSDYYNDPGKSSSPHTVTFFDNSSSKVDSMYWKFDDDSIAYNVDTVTHTYLWPGDYYPVLVVENTKSACIDSIEYSEGIDVEKYEFEMPNIFILDGNNIYRCYDVSVTYFDIVIVSRWGQKVHEFKGNIRDWEGWDGKIKGSDRYAKSGVYYYYIYTMDGWDSWDEQKNRAEKSHIGKDVRNGFFHVFNQM